MNIGVRIRTPKSWDHEDFVQSLRGRLVATYYLQNETVDPSVDLLITNDLSAAELTKLPHLQALVCPTSGREGIPFRELKNRNIAVYLNFEQIGDCVAAYAEHYVLDFSVLNDRERLDGQKIVILGYGNVGSRVFKRLAAHGGNYIIVRKDVDIASVEYPCEYITLHNARAAISDADIVVNALPLNNDTRGALSRDVYYRPAAVVLGLSRAGIIDEYAIAQSVLDGKLSAAILDVYPSELESFKNIHPRLVLTGHIAGIWGKGSKHLVDFVLKSVRLSSSHRQGIR